MPVLGLHRIHPGSLTPPITLDSPDTEWYEDYPPNSEDQQRPIESAFLDPKRYKSHECRDGDHPVHHCKEHHEAGMGLPLLFLSLNEPDVPGVSHNSESLRLSTDLILIYRHPRYPARSRRYGAP